MGFLAASIHFPKRSDTEEAGVEKLTSMEELTGCDTVMNKFSRQRLTGVTFTDYCSR